MFRSPWEIDVHARYRADELAASGRRPASRPGRARQPLASIRKGLGRDLIALGERLCGVEVPAQRRAARPAAPARG